MQRAGPTAVGEARRESAETRAARLAAAERCVMGTGATELGEVRPTDARNGGGVKPERGGKTESKR
jgi:hypothetical protein